MSPQPAGATSDTSPPQLVSFAFTPTTVDVSDSSATITVTAEVTDNASGVQSVYVYFFNDSTLYQATQGDLTRISGTPLDGIYQGTLTIPEFTPGGTYPAALTSEDNAGNDLSVSSTQLAAAGDPSTLAVEDGPTVTVTAVSPNHGPTGGGTGVTITGTGFSTGASNTVFVFGSLDAINVSCSSSTSCSAITPAGSVGTVDVLAATNGEASTANPPGDEFSFVTAAGGTIQLGKSTNLIGNYAEEVSGTGWGLNGDTTVTLNECATTSYSPATCDPANQVKVTLGGGGGTQSGAFTKQLMALAVGSVSPIGDTCGVAGALTCYVVAVGNTGDETSSTALDFSLPKVRVGKSTSVLGNYRDTVTATDFPRGDTVTAQECEASASPSIAASRCDGATQISGTASAIGKVSFLPGAVTLLVGDHYADTSHGICMAGGSCQILVIDASNPMITSSISVTFALPAATLARSVSVPANYIDKVTAKRFPIGDTVTAQECDSSVNPATTLNTDCDSATVITGTVSSTGTVVFAPTGVTVRVGRNYTESGTGTCALGGTCDIAISDSTNSGIWVVVPISLAP